jgi:hypothetical protein
MGWWRWWRGPWPGHGPFSCLPPWERPGWALGWWAPYWPGYAYHDPESERRALEAYKLYLEDLRSWVEEEIKRVDKRLSELKSS